MGTQLSVAAIILAAGRSSRMQGPNKLVAQLGGRPIVRIVAEAALASHASPVTVVTGHQSDLVRSALSGLPVEFALNPNFAEGLSTSLKTGIAALSPRVDAAIVLLGDMPAVTAAMIDRLISAHDPQSGAEIIVAAHGGQRGNPVLWPQRFFAELLATTGDAGGRTLLRDHAALTREVDLGPAVLLDLDTREALAAAGGVIAGGDSGPKGAQSAS